MSDAAPERAQSSGSASATPAPNAADARVEGVLVWDLPLRVFHWLLALSVAGSFVTHWIGQAAFEWHVRCGYATLVLLAFRIAWGFVGPAHARFTDFVRGPRAAWRYARGLFGESGGDTHGAGHNPLGGWMVLLLLAALAVQAVSGLYSNDDVVNAGPLYGYVDADRSDAISSVHRQLANGILAAVALHVVAAFAYLMVRRENLIGAMITGRKSNVPAAAAIRGHRVPLALVLVALAALALWRVIATAPEYELLLF